MGQRHTQLSTIALITFLGTLACAPVASGTPSAESYQHVLAETGPGPQSPTNDLAKTTRPAEGTGRQEGTAEAVGVSAGEEGPCGISEQPQAFATKSGSLRRPPPITLGYPWEPADGLEEDSCEPISESTRTTSTSTSDVVGSTPPETTTVASSAPSEGATSADRAEAGAGGGNLAVAWGNDYPSGQLGAGYKDSYEVAPVLVRGVSGISSMVPAGETSYALLDSGVVRAWGSPGQGELGNDEQLRKAPDSPVGVVEKTDGGEIREMTDVTAIAAAFGAFTHAMALVSDGLNGDEVMTWGASALGERGNGEYGREDQRSAIEPRNLAIAVPALEHKHLIAIAAGGDSDFALQAEGSVTTVWAWGGNQSGKLGIGGESGKTCEGDGVAGTLCTPTPQRVDLSAVPRGARVTSISAGRHSAYAILSDGRVLAWGGNAYGQLGDGTTENSDVPTYVCAQGDAKSCPHGPYLEHVKAVSGGELFALALLEDGKVVGWGVNASGSLTGKSHEQCANKELASCQRTPKTIEGLQGVTAISAGSDYALALVNDSEHQGQVYSWGSNEQGQLGGGSARGPETCGKKTVHHGGTVETIERQCSRRPLPVNGLSGVVGISASDGADPFNGCYGHSFAYLPSGEAPAPLLTVTPEEKQGKQALQVNWTVASSPESDYKVKWKEKPPASDANMIKVEELETEIEEDLTDASESREAAEAAEEAGDGKVAQQDIRDQEEYKGKAAMSKEEQRQYEEAAEREYPWGEIAKVTKTCWRGSREWCETITEAPAGKDHGGAPLSGETSYEITLNVDGGGSGDHTMHIVATTLP